MNILKGLFPELIKAAHVLPYTSCHLTTFYTTWPHSSYHLTTQFIPPDQTAHTTWLHSSWASYHTVHVTGYRATSCGRVSIV